MSDSRAERKLVADLRSGRREAFEQLLDLYQDRVYNLVRGMVGDADAEDVAQDALVEICRSVQSFRGESALSTWVHRVAVNVCLQHRRKRRPEAVALDYDLAECEADCDCEPCAVAVRNQVAGDVQAAVRTLPEIHRDVVILHEMQGLTYRECADALGCPVGTVKSRLSNAFGKLRELLGSYAGEGGAAL